MEVLLYFASILLTGALAGFLAAYAWRQRNVPGSRAYAGLALGECFLSLAEIMSVLSPTAAQALFWWQVRFPALAAIPVLWLVFALEYSGRKDWLSKRLLAVMFVVPVLTQVLLWSNSLHGLWVRQEVGFHRNGPFWIAEISARLPGLGFLVHSFYGLILLLIGIVLLLVAAWRMRHLYRGQALLVAGAASTAFVFAINAIFNLIPQTEFNPFTPGIGLSVLLIALAVFRFQFLKHAPAAETGSKAHALESQAGRSLAVFLLIFILMAAGIAAVGYLSFQNYESRFRAQVESQIASIAELKVSGLVGWRAERMGDAQVMRQNPAFAALAARYLGNPADTQAQAQIQAWLDSLRSSYHYDRVFLLDTGGVERISSPAAPEPVAAHLAQEADAISSAGQVTFLDFHRDTADGPIYLALLAPIFAGQEGNRPLGILVLRIDPSVYLYPFIQQWPVPSASAETLLIRREGTDALFLNELRFQTGTALNLRVPLENTQTPAVQAALGQVGIVEGVDYRGAPVIAAVRAVPGSPWFLVARMDTAEVYAPLRERLWQTLIFFAALIAASGAGLMLVWRQQRVRYYRGQVESARALQNSHALLAATLESTADGLLVVDRAGKVTSFNRKFLELWRIPESLAATRDDEQLLQFVLAQLQYPDAFLAKVQKLYQTPDAGAMDELAFKDGRIFERYSQPQCYGDTVVGRVWSFRDITERKRQEAQILAAQAELQRLLAEADQSRRALLSVVEDQKTVEEALRESNRRLNALNRVGLALAQTLDLPTIYRTACEHLSQLVDCPCFGISLYDPAAKTLRAEYMLSDGELLEATRFPPLTFQEGQPLKGRARAISTQQPEIVADMPSAPSDKTVVVGAPGDDRLARSALYVPLVARGQTIGLLEVQSYRDHAYGQAEIALLGPVANQIGLAIENARLFADLEAERNSLAQRVRERTAQLQAANQELESFAYSVSHDLRAPLRGIDGWSLALLEDCYAQLDDQARQYLDRVRAEAQRMGRLIDDLLQLSRVTRAEMRQEPVDLSALAHTVAARLKEAQPERQVELVIQPGLTAQGDARLLEIALTNLLGNAWKFTGARPQARIEFGQTEVEGRPAFYVRDNGVGYDMAYAEKLFGAFQRMHKTSEFPGTGIGLAIVQRIVHRHGGRAWAEAHVDQGATFYFTLEEAA